MPLQHQIEEAASPAALTSASETPRYDAAVVQKVIALADELQTRHRETLSTDEMEALGREVGVEPEFVQRALAQITAQSDKPTVTVSNKRKRDDSAEQTLRPLTLRQWAVAAVPVILYSLLLPLTFGWFNENEYAGNTDGILMIALFLIFPALLALFSGVGMKSKRLGAFSGGLFGLSAMVLIMTNSIAHGWNNTEVQPGEFYAMLAFFLGGGVTMGFMGAGLQQFTEWAKRRPNPVVANLKTEDWV